MASIEKVNFQEKEMKKSSKIKGTNPSPHNSQLLISSGIAHFDGLIGGGIPVGSILLINEDEYGAYAKFVFKYFLAEGVASKHDLFVCSEDINQEELVKELPSIVDDDINDEVESSTEGRKMTIAWRYENLKRVSTFGSSVYFGHHFDLSHKIEDSSVTRCNITYFKNISSTSGGSFESTEYFKLLNEIKIQLENGKYFTNQTTSERNILRIGLHHLNSPQWQYDLDESQNSLYFFTFLYQLRGLIRNSYATCVITLPSSKIKNPNTNKYIHLSDIAIQLQSFTGTKYENISPYKDYHGFLIIQKIAAINSLVAYNSQATNLAFKLKRKKLVIEEFNLPPALDDENEDDQNDSYVLTCSSSRSSKLDF